MLSRLSIAAVLFSLSGLPALADAHHNMDCSNLDPARDGDADIAFLCLADYQERLEQLEQKMAKLIDGNTGDPFAPDIPKPIPTGMVAAFDRAGKCPADWSPFAEGQGRVVIGASFNLPDGLFRADPLSQYKYRDHGGEEDVTLSKAQMPEHRHEGPGENFHLWWYKVGGGANHRVIDEWSQTGSIPNGFAEVRDTPDFALQSAGGSEPHNNMPPYIALYLCSKD